MAQRGDWRMIVRKGVVTIRILGNNRTTFKGVRMQIFKYRACLLSFMWAWTLPVIAQSIPDLEIEAKAILTERCLSCHNPDLISSGLILSTRKNAIKGGESGKPALVPGNPEKSLMIEKILAREMPLGNPLPAEEREILRKWVAAGAPWNGALISTSPSHSKGGLDWWSFKTPINPPVPRVNHPRWSKNPIDAFIKNKLEDKGLHPASRADKRTLIRRAYLDFVGLLPNPQEVTAFVQDNSKDAFEKVIDQLLDSPHYGERWGRHWLDVVRYGDSGGYEKDFDYPQAWRYRDYVIQSLNKDIPYDQFILEQLAGDELDEVTYDSLTATGFHRVGATVGFREKDNPQYRYTYLNDMIGTTSRAFMALSVECARCHDHKFDPIQQLDYYRMMATFFPFVKFNHPLAPPEQVSAYKARKANIRARINPLEERILKIEKPYKKLAFMKKLKTFPEEIQGAVRTAESERTPGQKLLAAQVSSIGVRLASEVELVKPKDLDEIKRLRKQIKEIQKELPKPLPMAMGIRDGDFRFAPEGPGDEELPGKGDREIYDFKGSFLPQRGKPYFPPPAYFLPTGDYQDKGPEVQPGFLQAITRGKPPTASPPSNGHVTTGRRRALAEWIISETHPLTARVMVNRIWQHHFGRGLVNTPSNFGRMGQEPTHPELLDWLASEFIQSGWSIKHMHRLMMTSETYQMSSAYNLKANTRIDSEGIFLWRYHQRRLEGEGIRDIILAASGKLNLKMGGYPFFPPIPAKVRNSAFPAGDIAGSHEGKWEVTREGPEVWRRSIYSYWKRGLRYPLFDVFDLPDLNVSCERRTVTTVPTQALTLLNNEFVIDQARYFAERVLRQAEKEQETQVNIAYQIALSRDPTPVELNRNIAFLQQQNSYHSLQNEDLNPEMEALTDLCHIILNLNEFIYIN